MAKRTKHKESVYYKAKAVMLLYTLSALRLATTAQVNSAIREMMDAKKNQRQRSDLDKIFRGL